MNATSQAAIPAWQQGLLDGHQLGAAYLDTARHWFAPLAARLAAHQRGAQRTILVGLNGCQGSGKSTLVDYLVGELAHTHGLASVALSLDDFYRTREERGRLATTVHPLLATRGVPGTHDIELLQRTLDALQAAGDGDVAIPRFDKARDDRRPPADWDPVNLPVQLVLLEGWCLGARAQEAAALAAPINSLEQDEDADGRWRRYVNDALAGEYQVLHRRVDYWVMLRAPSFACVRDWRREQEDKLRATLAPGATDKTMDDAALARFIQHYQRLTEHCLQSLPAQVDELLELDAQRRVIAERHP